jgi:prolyl-tRNA synthetase
MTHGDQQGLVLPPRVAPVQAVLIPIFKTEEERSVVVEKMEKLRSELEQSGLRVVLDADPTTTPGAKFFHWELKGVPVRIEMGPKDLVSDQVVLVNRTEPDKAKKKTFVSISTAKAQLNALLDTIQHNLLSNARARMQSQWHHAEQLADFGPRLDAENGIYQTGWCGSAACEAAAKTYKGTIRCIRNERTHQHCFNCSSPSKNDVLVAKAY